MSARTRRSTAIGIVAAVTTGTALLLSGCEPTASAQPPANTGTSSATPKPVASPSSALPPPPLNGTAHNGLTISNGTQIVVMNGTTVDFGTVVRDLAWSPDGKKAAFVDGNGDLVVSNPDGTGKTVIARNPGGQTWSHPAWQVTGESPEHVPPKNFLFFAADKGGTTRLERVSAAGGTPEELSLNSEAGENAPVLPTTGNVWPNTGGTHGSAVYANTGTGQIYIRDEYLRQQGDVLTHGSQPALSPDEHEVVFVRSVDGHDHLFVETLDGNNSIKDLTPNATTDYTEPAWSPDGKTIAVRTPSGIDTLPAWGHLPAPLGAGGGSAAPTHVSGYTGLPTYRS